MLVSGGGAVASKSKALSLATVVCAPGRPHHPGLEYGFPSLCRGLSYTTPYLGKTYLHQHLFLLNYRNLKMIFASTKW